MCQCCVCGFSCCVDRMSHQRLRKIITGNYYLHQWACTYIYGTIDMVQVRRMKLQNLILFTKTKKKKDQPADEALPPVGA